MDPESLVYQLNIQPRLVQLEKKLDEFPVEAFAPAEADLTFEGAPVKGSVSIEPYFAGRVLQTFSKLYRYVRASLKAESLDEVERLGRMPGANDRSLHFGSLTLGSFGFHFEESVDGLSESEIDEETGYTFTRLALERTRVLMASVASSDEETANAFAGLSDRVMNPLREFLEELRKGGATCSIRTGASRFRFDNSDDVKDACERASRTLTEQKVTSKGVLRGLMPDEGEFSVLLDGATESVKGKVSKKFDIPSNWTTRIDEPSSFTFTVRKLTGGQREVKRYILEEWDALADSDNSEQAQQG
jgi:hypothetical protein